ncbi:uncharacterized protein LOC119724523 [Patiria miniata]|uniref:Uncharacterized protein n=1 Tax=Patiria miniata TaxID=46514 RepID=A0A913ZIC7_PATMI|nr:uncharacterized protein LOC119724523 [Patiria miniata]
MEALLALQQSVVSQIGCLQEEQLQQVCTELGVDEHTASKESARLALIRRLTRHLNSETMEDMEDKGQKVFEDLRDFLKTITPGTSSASKDPPATPESSSTSTVEPAPSPPALPVNQMVGLLKKEFRISGQVGEPGQKDRLSHSNLIMQIESGLRKSYKEVEIVEAVIRSISPGMRLRSYLESTEGLTLPTLREILEAHYREGNATEIYQELSSASQGSTESAHDFLVRTLDLRQKILKASKMESTIKYDPGLVQNMFLHSLNTGLQNDNIRGELKPLLFDPTTSDESLFRQLKIAEGREIVRLAKQKKAKTAVKVQEVSAVEKQQLDLMKQLQQIQADLAALKVSNKQAAEKPKSSEGGSRNPPSREWGCNSCRQAGKGPECDHCFACGSSEHFRRGCKQRRQTKQSGNGSRASGGDA